MSRFHRKPLPESRNPRASHYSAFDFVITPTGEWVFLEVNPGGQFGFLEDETDAPLTATLADLLARGTP